MQSRRRAFLSGGTVLWWKNLPVLRTEAVGWIVYGSVYVCFVNVACEACMLKYGKNSKAVKKSEIDTN